MSGVTIRDMENLATSLPDINIGNDIGNVIEISDLGGDDFGMGLLANTKLMNTPQQQQTQPQQQQQQQTYQVSPQPMSGMQEVDITRIDPLEPIQFNIADNGGGGGFSIPSINVQHEQSQPFSGPQSSTGPSVTMTAAPMRDLEAEKKEKADFINKLARLEQKGFPVSRRYTQDNTLDEIKSEYFRLVDARQLETSIRFQRNMMMGFVTGMEWMNNKFDPFDLKLDGWSESVHENVEDYDEIFEELYDKYKEKGKMPPEARLLFTVAGSGFMCHITNSFFRSKMPSKEDIFKNNPELARQFAAAAAQQASPGFGNFMSMAMGVPPGGQQQGAAPAPQYNPNIADPGPGPGQFYGSSQQQMPNSPMSQMQGPPPTIPIRRREMKGPTGVDDILKTFDEVRRAEESQNVFTPPSPLNGNDRPAVVAASEIQSINSEDMGSVATGKTGAGRRGGNRRRAPVENTIMLNV